MALSSVAKAWTVVWRHGTKESFRSKHRRDRERKETADRGHCREANHLSFSCADSMSVPPDQTFPTGENRPKRVSSPDMNSKRTLAIYHARSSGPSSDGSY